MKRKKKKNLKQQKQQQQNKRLQRKRLITFILTIFLIIMGIVLIILNNVQTATLCFIFAALGAIFTINKKIPNWIYEFNDIYTTYIPSGRITRDDDEANLPLKIYLPIILGAILLALSGFLYYKYFS